MNDKYSAVWVSHSSLSDYMKCPRLYFLRNMYKDPKTQHKMAIMQPALALGQSIHDTIEEISRLPVHQRFEQPLQERFEMKWNTVTGKKGGFSSSEEEQFYKEKGAAMIQRITENPGPILQKAVKIKQDLPHYYLSELENIILCGKIDWLEYKEESDSVHIIDFKTGKYDEDPLSLQLPIYYLLVTHTQSRLVTGASYWYLERDAQPLSVSLPQEKEAHERVLEAAKKVALARKLEHLKCKQKDGCRFCKPYEDIISGKGEFVGTNPFGQDVYILPRNNILPTEEQSVEHPTDEPF